MTCKLGHRTFSKHLTALEAKLDHSQFVLKQQIVELSSCKHELEELKQWILVNQSLPVLATSLSSPGQVSTSGGGGQHEGTMGEAITSDRPAREETASALPISRASLSSPMAAMVMSSANGDVSSASKKCGQVYFPDRPPPSPLPAFLFISLLHHLASPFVPALSFCCCCWN